MHSLIEKAPKNIAHLLDIQKLNRYLPSIFNVVLIIACSYTLAQITWLLIPVDETSQAPVTQNLSKASGRQKSAQQQKIQQISNAHLFGQYQAVVTKVTKTDAPETRLNLILKGVLASVPMTNASAIIALGKRGKEDIFGIGDKVSSATVREIHADHVILERAGKLETLRLPKDKDDLIKSAPSSRPNLYSKSSPKRPSSRILPESTPSQVLSDIRKKIMKNPTSFGQYAIPIPYNENGKLRGYRLKPQADRALFDQVGLQPNDVIVDINGISLNNPANGLKALGALQRAKRFEISVLRNGSVIPLSFEMP
jgi:general secretion pathway protein C